MLPILSWKASSRDVDSSRRTRAQAAVSFDLVCPLVVHRASLALAQHWSVRQRMSAYFSFIVEHCFHDVHGVEIPELMLPTDIQESNKIARRYIADKHMDDKLL
jgi:hypothetical protein